MSSKLYYTYKEAADHIGCDIKAVKSFIRRGLISENNGRIYYRNQQTAFAQAIREVMMRKTVAKNAESDHRKKSYTGKKAGNSAKSKTEQTHTSAMHESEKIANDRSSVVKTENKTPLQTETSTPAVALSRQTYFRYIADGMHAECVIPKIMSVTESLLISTANLKNLYVDYHAEKVPFIKVISELVARKVKVRILCARPSLPLQNELANHENLQEDSEYFQIQSCPQVHMKMIVLDGKELYMGSANITNAAMGKRSTRDNNFEAGLLTNEKSFVIKAMSHFDKAWNKPCASCKVKDCRTWED